MQSDYPVVVYDVQLSHPERACNAPPNFRSSPMRILTYDLALVIRHAAEIPFMFLPLPTMSSGQKDVTIAGVLLQAVFLVVSLGVTGSLVTALGIGFPVPILALLALGLVIKGMGKLQGRIRKNKDDTCKDEAWIFVNGIGTSASGLQIILDELHRIFRRQVIGVHNKTYGIWWDLVECLLQRDLLWPTRDVREGYQTVCRYISDPTKKKVVLMAHSQGGIIMATWVDQLLADFNADDLRKVEIYTFASAANHFAVPSTTDVSGAKRYVFGIVEHFVNTRDYVSLIGLIEFAPGPLAGTRSGTLPPTAAEGRFAGRIFRRIGHTGHLLVTHYLAAADSILDHPTVNQYSQLCRYKGGAKPAVEERMWKETDQSTLSPSAVRSEPAAETIRKNE